MAEEVKTKWVGMSPREIADRYKWFPQEIYILHNSSSVENAYRKLRTAGYTKSRAEILQKMDQMRKEAEWKL